LLLELIWADDEDESSSKLAGSNGKSSRILSELFCGDLRWFDLDLTRPRVGVWLADLDVITWFEWILGDDNIIGLYLPLIRLALFELWWLFNMRLGVVADEDTAAVVEGGWWSWAAGIIEADVKLAMGWVVWIAFFLI
jgi:hypothetical protein